jgi:hypothetical protein
MTGQIKRKVTEVPLDGGKDVTLLPERPWPSTYRGSKYSLVESRKHNRDVIVQWKHQSLKAHAHAPDGLLDAMQAVGKSLDTGKGSFRVTAAGEVLTKVHADSYPRADEAPHANGWIPVYLGKLTGDIGFTKLNNDPSVEPPSIWDGLPFNHGETWAVSVNDRLIWKQKGNGNSFRFESAFDHPELVETYQQFRRIAGRLYINEYGHIWINAPTDGVPEDRHEEVLEMYSQWRERTERNENDAARRLVTQRLKATSPDDDLMNGHMPLYIGHLSEFDDGLVPRPVVTDTSYFVACSRSDTKTDDH